MPLAFDPALLDFLESRVLGNWDGTVWRGLLGDAPPLRPNQRGARWNPPGVEALYCSLLAETAAAEIDYLVSLQPVPVSRRRLAELRVELTRVVDLSDTTPLASFGLQSKDLTGKASTGSRLVGSAVSWLGCAGLLVPSARHAGANLVIYTNQMDPRDRIDLL